MAWHGLKGSLRTCLLLLAAGGLAWASPEAEPLAPSRDFGRGDQVSVDLPATPSLDDYVGYALARNPGLQAMEESWRAAEARVPQARALPDPMVEYESEAMKGDWRNRAELRQTFPWFGKRSLMGEEASDEAAAAAERYVMQRLRLIYDVKLAYGDYYYVARATEVMRAQREFLVYMEAAVRTRYSAAAAQYADLVRAQVELAKAENELSALVDLRPAVAARLNALLNRPAGASLSPPGPWPDEHLTARDDVVLIRAEAGNPELAAMARELSARQHGVKLAHKAYYPDVTLGVGFASTGDSPVELDDDRDDAVMGMVSVSVPLWFRKLSAGVREARAAERAAVHARDDAANALAARVKMALYEFRDAERRVDLYGDTLLPKAEQSLQASETAFRGGTATFLDVLDSARVLLEFKLARERAVVDRMARLAELDMLVGRGVVRWAEESPAPSSAPAHVLEDEAGK